MRCSGGLRGLRGHRAPWADGIGLAPIPHHAREPLYLGELVIDNPQQKTRNQDITCEPKKENQQKGRKRIVVEHLIRLVKIFRLAAERFRLISENYDPVILLVCGLIRWRIGAIVMCN
jgi:hypothetical protein